MDFFNSTIIPFTLMVLLSAALIHTVRASRMRVHATNSSSSQSKRDNRFAISAVTLNLMFFLLNLPIVVYDLISTSVEVSELLDYSVQFLYYTYYATSFYVQLIVNSEFKREFLKLINLREMTAAGTDLGTTKAHDLDQTNSIVYN